MKTICTLKETNQEDMGWYATGHLFKEIKRVLSDHDICVIGLSGGQSVAGMYHDIEHEILFTNVIGQNSFFTDDEWQRIHFVYADERAVGPQDKYSNYALTKNLFLDALTTYTGFPEHHVHRYYGENEDQEASMQAYTQALRSLSDGHIHILLLGAGEDGHIASLFPHSLQLTETKQEYLWVTDSPKPPKKRITISPQHVRSADATFLFFCGEHKQHAYDNFTNQEININDCPAKLCLEGEPQERLYVVTDRK